MTRKNPPRFLKRTCLLGLCWILLGGVLSACVPQSDSPVLAQTPTSTWLPVVVRDNVWWQPKPGSTWQIQYEDDIDLSLSVDIYNLDMFETTPGMIQSLKDRGIHTICYINAGGWEDWRPDQDAFPPEVLGNDYEGWPGEKWLDIRRIDLLAPIMTARLDLCAEKGFDGVDPDNLEGYTNNTGFPLTYADQLAYNIWFANEAHSRGLAVGLKNDPEQVLDLLPHFDWAVTESCFDEGWCHYFTPFIDENKPVFAIEYTDNGTSLDDFCAQAAALSIDAILKHRQLDAWLAVCP